MILKQTLFFILYFFILSWNHTTISNDYHLVDEKNPVITGRITDSEKSEAIPYANVVIYNAIDSTIVKGVTSDVDGIFVITNLKAGQYFLTIQSIGFTSETFRSIDLNNINKSVDLGTIQLEASSTEIEGVDVIGKRSTITFETDRKVLHVGTDITDMGGNAVDAVKKLPSVQVDYQGNVTIRGSSDFKVLINDKPTALSGQEELEKIPVMMIDKIELITNASAEYDPEGTAAIINIITKKQKWIGLNGQVEAAYNFNNSKSTGIQLGYKLDRFSINSGFSYNETHWIYKNKIFQTSLNDLNEVISDRSALGSLTNIASNYYYTLGADFEPDTNNYFSVSGTYLTPDRKYKLENNYQDLNLTTSSYDYFSNLAYRTWHGPEYRLNGSFEHYFRSRDHKISLNAYLNGIIQNHDNSSDNFSTNDDWTMVLSNTSYYHRINEVHRTDMRITLSYERPIGKKSKLNTGYDFSQYFRTDSSNTDTDFLPSNISVYDTIPHIFGDYTRNVHAVFTTFEGSLKQFHYKLGGRFEIYNRKATVNVEQKNLNENFTHFFPSVHFTYKLPKEKQLALSYSKRTYRPVSWMIFRISTYHNKNYTYMGNPDLEPMYAHNMEFSFNKKWKNANLYTELYYSKLIHSIQTVFIPDTNDVRVGYPVNIRHHYSSGSSTMFNFEKIKWLSFRQGLDLYYIELLNSTFYSSFSFNTSTMVNINLGKLVNITINNNYYAPSASVQGKTKGQVFTEIGISKKFLNNKGTFAITIWDPFKMTSFDSKRSEKNYRDRYYYYNNYMNLNIYISYQFNNYSKYNQKHRNSGSNINSTRPSFLTQ